MPPRNDAIDVFKLYDIGNDDECWQWNGTWNGSPRGNPYERRPYFMVARQRKLAYRWVFELLNGVELTRDQAILHSCDNGTFPIGCGNIHHLRIGTNTENMGDANTRQRLGMPHNVVRAIRTLLEEGRTQEDIAKLYGIARETVSKIATGRSHKNVV